MSSPSGEARFVDVLVDENGACEACALRFKMEDEARPVHAVRWYGDDDQPVDCDVTGWSAEAGGSPVPALGCTIEDSSAGVAVLVWGGDWGLRLSPRNGRAAFAESHLRIAPEDVIA
jgi:hypothetical protein